MVEQQTMIMDEETVNELTRAHYDYENYKDVIQSCLDIHKLDPDDSFINSVIFKSYQDKMNEAFTVYNKLKAKLEHDYSLMNTNWNLDFSTGELTYTPVD